MARGDHRVVGKSGVLGCDRTMAYVTTSLFSFLPEVDLLIVCGAENYMEHPLHHDTRQPPGALGLGQAMSTRIYCAFYLFYYATPIIVAIVADRYLGRYTTLVVSVILYCLGCVALTVSSVSSNLEKGWGVPGLLVAMFLVGLGGGGFRAIFVTFIADQQIRTEPRPVMLKNGELVIIDYQITLQYIYNLYYWSVRPLFRRHDTSLTCI